MALDYPYIQVIARDSSDGSAVVNLKIGDDSFGVDQQRLVDAVKDVLNATAGVTAVSAARYEMSLTTTEM